MNFVEVDLSIIEITSNIWAIIRFMIISYSFWKNKKEMVYPVIIMDQMFRLVALFYVKYDSKC